MDPPIPLEEAPSIGVAATPPSAPDLEEAHQPLRAAHSQDPTKITKTLETIAHVRIASLKSIQEVLSQSTDSEDIVWADWIADHYINQPSQKEETSAIVTPYALNILFQSFKRARTLSNRTICTDEWPFYTTGFKKLTQQMIKQLIKPVQEFNYAPSGKLHIAHEPLALGATKSLLHYSAEPAGFKGRGSRCQNRLWIFSQMRF